MGRKTVTAIAALTAACAIGAPTASAGYFLPVGAGKAAIRSELSYYQVGTNWSAKVDMCFKPAGDKVKCFWQKRELYGGFWFRCYGTATATERFGYTAIHLQRGWIDRCQMSDWRPSFV